VASKANHPPVIPDCGVEDRIVRQLRNSRPSDNPEQEALASLPAQAARRLFAVPLVPAAVLVGIVERGMGHALILTIRSSGLRDHPGQISFPGGRLSELDADPTAAALRETHEELGIHPNEVRVVGYLRPQAVVSGFVIMPVVGFLRKSVRIHPDPLEVADVIELPLSFLEDPQNESSSVRLVRGVELPLVEYNYLSYRIWGATAAILQSLANEIR